ncbi:MAG: 1-deoxy-D-xylulose-5-phosphate reductoisomerase [Thermoanaerobaculia bacterium]
MKRLALLGATGSIGRSTIAVVRHHPERFAIAALAATGRKLEELAALAREFRPRLVVVTDAAARAPLAAAIADPAIEVASGAEALAAAANLAEVDLVVAAMVGAAGLAPVHAAVAAGKSVALANKEALVVAGGLLTRLAAATGAALLPIDSEHVALHQALRSGARGEVRRLVLTASGGPFRRREPATWAAITPDEALRHPTWSMGAKISIDSATLMNKGLELIEASHLFAVPAAAIEVVVHPQSIVHSLVEFRDGSWLAQLAPNDMVFPIQYALSYPERWENRFARLEPARLGALEFEPLDVDRFPAPELARRALAAGASAPAVLNAANEVAVESFLAGRIPFPAIVEIVRAVLDEHRPGPVGSLGEALSWDAWGRDQARSRLASLERTR